MSQQIKTIWLTEAGSVPRKSERIPFAFTRYARTGDNGTEYYLFTSESYGHEYAAKNLPHGTPISYVKNSPELKPLLGEGPIPPYEPDGPSETIDPRAEEKRIAEDQFKKLNNPWSPRPPEKD